MLANITLDQWILWALSVVVSVLLAVYTLRFSARRHRILYDFESVVLAQKIEHNQIEYMFGGEVVPSIVHTSIFVRSFGNTIIEEGELSSPGSLDFFVGDGKILEAYLWDGQVHSSSSLMVSDDGHAFSIRADRIAPGDNFKVHLYTDHLASRALECRTYVLGKSSSIRRIRKAIEYVTILFPLIFPGLVVAFFATLSQNFGILTSWWGQLAIYLTLSVFYGSIFYFAYEHYFGSHAKMRKMKNADMIGSDYVANGEAEITQQA